MFFFDTKTPRQSKGKRRGGSGPRKHTIHNSSMTSMATETTRLLRGSLQPRRHGAQLWRMALFVALAMGIFLVRQTRHPSVVLNQSSFIDTKSLPRLGSVKNRLVLPPTCPRSSVVLLVRHCEDGTTERLSDLSRHCNPLGFQRSEYLATLFGSRWPQPSHLYGLAKSKNMKQYETLVPLANRTGLGISMIEYERSQHDLVIAHVQDLVDLCDSPNLTTTAASPVDKGVPMVTVVSWKHAYIPELARAMGCDHCPDEWPDDDFDSVWELHYQWVESASHKTTMKVFGSVVQQNFDPLAYQYAQANKQEPLADR